VKDETLSAGMDSAGVPASDAAAAALPDVTSSIFCGECVIVGVLD
jgi:hypothetical protein